MPPTLSTLLLFWSSLLRVAAVPQPTPELRHRQFPETTSACSAYCHLDGPSVSIYAWATPSHPFARTVTSVILTSTIVTIINMAANTTTTSTEFPPEYNYVPTNDDHTQVQTISYTRHRETLVTTLTFPTIFIAWPDWYAWSGTMPVSSNIDSLGSATTTCLTNHDDTTTWLTDFPQPTAGPAREAMQQSILFRFNTSDPGGLLFRPVSDTLFFWEFSALSTMFPGHPAVTTCTNGNGDSGPNWAGFTETRWMDPPATTTLYIREEGGGETQSEAVVASSAAKEESPSPVAQHTISSSKTPETEKGIGGAATTTPAVPSPSPPPPLSPTTTTAANPSPTPSNPEATPSTSPNPALAPSPSQSQSQPQPQTQPQSPPNQPLSPAHLAVTLTLSGTPTAIELIAPTTTPGEASNDGNGQTLPVQHLTVILTVSGTPTTTMVQVDAAPTTAASGIGGGGRIVVSVLGTAVTLDVPVPSPASAGLNRGGGGTGVSTTGRVQGGGGTATVGAAGAGSNSGGGVGGGNSGGGDGTPASRGGGGGQDGSGTGPSVTAGAVVVVVSQGSRWLGADRVLGLGLSSGLAVWVGVSGWRWFWL